MFIFRLALAAALVPLWTVSAWAVDAAQPARIQYTVRDDQKTPIAGANITLTAEDSSAGVKPLTVMTDAQGNASVERRSPGTSYTWDEHLRIEKDGYIALDGRTAFFSGEEDVPVITLPREHKTIIHVRGPKGEVAAGVPLMVWWANDYSRQATGQTDARGDYVWSHAAANFFDLFIDGQSTRSPDVPELTATLTADQQRRFATPRTLEGTLLLPDGIAAKGWLVGTEVTRDASGGSNLGPQDYFRVARWQQIGVDGKFSTDHPSKFLMVLSPEGLPMVYALNPESWPEGKHTFALTIPPVRETVTGRLVDSDGKPVASMLVSADSMVGYGRRWRVSDADVPSASAVSHGLTQGPQPGQILTDADGRFSIPLYGEMQASSWNPGVRWPPSDIYAAPSLGQAPQSTLKHARTGAAGSSHNAADYKDITLVFVDSKGNRIGGPRVETLTVSPDTNRNTFGESPFKDMRGAHYFVAKNVAQVTVQTSDGLWKPMTKRFELAAGGGDQDIGFALDASLRYKPIRGRVLDAAGKPVAQASVSAFDENIEPNRGTGGRRYLSHATTDEQGRFEIAGAPDDCKLQVSATDPATDQLRFPWMEPIVVTAEHRDIEVHAPAGGSVRVLLPDILRPTRRPELLRADKPAEGISVWSMSFDAAAHTLFVSGIPAGSYSLDVTRIPELAAFPDPQLTVTANQTTVVDWRKQPLAASAGAPIRSLTMDITADGKPFNGAEVAVFREPRKNEYASQELIAVTLDLSDAAGKIYVSAQEGVDYVAVARVRGRYVGSTAFRITGANPPAQSVVLHAPPATTSTATQAAASPLESRALGAAAWDELWGTASSSSGSWGIPGR